MFLHGLSLLILSDKVTTADEPNIVTSCGADGKAGQGLGFTGA